MNYNLKAARLRQSFAALITRFLIMHHPFSVCRERAILYRLFIRSVEATQADVEEDHRSIICAPNALF